MKNIYLRLLLLVGILPETLWAQVIVPPGSGTTLVPNNTTITVTDSPAIQATGPDATVNLGSGVTVNCIGQVFCFATTNGGTINATAGGLKIRSENRATCANFDSFDPLNLPGGTINILGNNNTITTTGQSGMALSDIYLEISSVEQSTPTTSLLRLPGTPLTAP